MAAKKKSIPRNKAAAPQPGHPAAVVATVAVRSLVNMAIVCTSCAVTLATLMAALKFQLV